MFSTQGGVSGSCSNSSSRWTGLVLAAVIALLPAAPAAQALYGTIAGTVTDDSGAAIPGATVTVTNQGTGLEVSAVFRRHGRVRHPQPPAGHLHREGLPPGLQGIRADRRPGQRRTTSSASTPSWKSAP